MSVLIKGMKMPKDCIKCPFCLLADGHWKCLADGSFADFGGTCRPPKCPLIEVPAPHGRLIDADGIDRAFSDSRWEDRDWRTGKLKHWGDRPDWCLTGAEVERLITAAPTIIEAEEGVNNEIL